MDDTQSASAPITEVDTALLDAELFIKYKSPERAITRLRNALGQHPRSVPLRERLREISAAHKHADEAARQCLALASLYIEREDFEAAYERLLEAKQFDPRINIAGGLEAIRRARQPAATGAAVPELEGSGRRVTLAGDLATINVFDVLQVIENAKLTGVLELAGPAQTAHVFFNEGIIVDAECADLKGQAAFRQIVEITSGSFELKKSAGKFPVAIQAASNTNLILDTLRHMDEQRE